MLTPEAANFAEGVEVRFTSAFRNLFSWKRIDTWTRIKTFLVFMQHEMFSTEAANIAEGVEVRFTSAFGNLFSWEENRYLDKN
jgi:hypothetical protein